MTKSRASARGKLGLLSLAAATYCMVSGGPYGLEELVQDSGYKLALLAIALTPLIWALPTALMVGELSAALPQEGGFYVWVRRSMGPFWGFQEAWLSLVASIFDMAIYPSLFVAYFGQLFPAAVRGDRGILIAAWVVLMGVLWNLFGAKAVGESSLVMAIILLVPFVLLTAVALFRHVTPVSTHVLSGDLLTGLLVVMWNYMGWDNAATVANEVDNPQKTYPRVMLLTLGIILLSYMIPVLAVWSTHLPQTAWDNGSWATIAARIVGPWLGVMLVATAMVAEFSAFNSLVMSYSHLPVAMAEDGHLPAVFTRKLKNGAPWVSILVLGLAWGLSLGLNFDRLIMLDILLYGASLVLEFLALIILRLREPNLPRPFRIPGGITAAVLVAVGPTLLLSFALIRNRSEHLDLGRYGNVSTLLIGGLLMALGVIYYFVFGRPKPATELAAAD